MRVMAIDYGDVRTGVAVSDPTGTLTGRTHVVVERNPGALADRLCRLIDEYGVTRVVLGNPLNMNATAGPRAQKSAQLAELIRARCGLEVVLWDERRTSLDAHRILSELNVRGKDRKDAVDAVAASLILEGYLSFLSHG